MMSARDAKPSDQTPVARCYEQKPASVQDSAAHSKIGTPRLKSYGKTNVQSALQSETCANSKQKCKMLNLDAAALTIKSFFRSMTHGESFAGQNTLLHDRLHQIIFVNCW